MIEPKDLKARIDQILTLADKANKLVCQFGTPEQKAADRAFNDAIRQLDVDAGSGCVPGRLVKFAAADNYARYIVLRVNKKTCKMVHIPYLDGYTSPAVNADGECWRDEVEDNLAWYETLKAAAEKLHTKQKPTVEPNLPPLPVVAAEPDMEPVA